MLHSPYHIRHALAALIKVVHIAYYIRHALAVMAEIVPIQLRMESPLGHIPLCWLGNEYGRRGPSSSLNNTPFLSPFVTGLVPNYSPYQVHVTASWGVSLNKIHKITWRSQSRTLFQMTTLRLHRQLKGVDG